MKDVKVKRMRWKEFSDRAYAKRSEANRRKGLHHTQRNCLENSILTATMLFPNEDLTIEDLLFHLKEHHRGRGEVSAEPIKSTARNLSLRVPYFDSDGWGGPFVYWSEYEEEDKKLPAEPEPDPEPEPDSKVEDIIVLQQDGEDPVAKNYHQPDELWIRVDDIAKNITCHIKRKRS